MWYEGNLEHFREVSMKLESFLRTMNTLFPTIK